MHSCAEMLGANAHGETMSAVDRTIAGASFVSRSGIERETPSRRLILARYLQQPRVG